MEEGRDSLSEEESSIRRPPNSPIPPHPQLSDMPPPPLRPSPPLRRVESLLELAKADYHMSCRRSAPMEIELARWHGPSGLDLATEKSATAATAASSRRYIPPSSPDFHIGHTCRTEASSSSALPHHELVAAGSPHSKTQCDAAFRQWRFEFGRFITEYDKYMRKSSNTLDLPERRGLEVLLPVLEEFGNIGLRYWFDHLRLEDEAHLENGGTMWEKSGAPSAEDGIPDTNNVESCTLNENVDERDNPKGKGKEVVRRATVNSAAPDGIDRKDWAVEAERKARRLASTFSSDPPPCRGQEKSTPLTSDQLETLGAAFSEARVFTRKLGITLSKIRHQQAQHPGACLLREGVTFAQLLAVYDSSSSASQVSPGSSGRPSLQVYDPSPPPCTGSFSYPKYARYARLLPEDISALQNALMSHCPLAGAALGLDLARDQYSLFYESIDAETQERYIDVLAPDPWHMSGALPAARGGADGCVPATEIQGVRVGGEAQPSTGANNHVDSDDDDNRQSVKPATAKEPLAAALSALWVSARLSLVNQAWRAGFVRDGDARRKFGKLRRRMEALVETSRSRSYPGIVAEKAKAMEKAASQAEVKGRGGRDGMVLLSLVDTECREVLGW